MTEQEQPSLPSWASWGNGQVIVDMDVVYPNYLEQLGLEATQYGTGVVKLCVTRDLRDMLGEDVTIRFKGSQDWKLSNLHHGLPDRHLIAYQDKRKATEASLKADEISAEAADEERQAQDEAWLQLVARSHDEGLKDGGKFRDRMIQKRAAKYLASE